MNAQLHRLFAAALLLAGLACLPQARAAESYDNCTGFIDTLPASISTQGTWCLRHDLSTSMSHGNAITIANNNVTIDCNDFKVGGLAAGLSTTARGIYAENRTNITIRNCALRGFWVGAWTSGGAGHLIEDNRVDSSIAVGLWVDGDNSIVRRNRVADIGGNTAGDITGIIAQGDQTVVADNVVTGVTGTPDPEGSAEGISFSGYAGLVRGNYISSILPGTGVAVGMKSIIGYMTIVEQNVILNPSATAGRGIDVSAGSSRPVCLNNRVRNFTVSAYDTCIDGGGNFSN